MSASKLIALFVVVAIGSVAVAPIALEPESVGPAFAPAPSEHPDAVIQVYGADVWGWRGHFAIHTWVAVKPEAADEYTNYQVIGWRLRRGQSAVSRTRGNPDRPWFGSEPKLLLDLRGDAAAALVERVEAAVDAYPYPNEYTMWPGPNSNSFTAWVGLEVPELDLELPFKALGQRWMKANYK